MKISLERVNLLAHLIGEMAKKCEASPLEISLAFTEALWREAHRSGHECEKNLICEDVDFENSEEKDPIN